MRLSLLLILVMSCCSLICVPANAQNMDAALHDAVKFPSSFFEKVDQKTASIEQQLTKNTEKYLSRLASQEQKLKKKLSRVDSSAASQIFAADPGKQYRSMADKLLLDSGVDIRSFTGEYMPYIDSLKGCLSFLKHSPQSISSSTITPQKIQQSLANLQRLQSKMQQAEQIKQLLQQRKQQLKNYLARQTSLPRSVMSSFKDYNKQAYYYGQQIREYKEALNQPDKIVKTALTLLNKLPAFAGFMKKHSMLASLFNIPMSDNQGAGTQAVAGLQTRTQLMSGIQDRLGSSAPDATRLIQKNVQSAQGQLNTLKEKLGRLGKDGKDLDMPDFQPNNQKTRSFLQRLEFGTNIQSTQSNSFFPTTTDIGLSAGYKLNDKSTIGIGASYKMGWGKSIQHIAITHQGVGIRSFLDIKLKGSFYASGGLEFNYQPPTPDSAFLLLKANELAWQRSGLIGVSKIVSLKSKVFKKTKLQLLWDFLSYQQRPQTQAFRFRVGYNF